MREPRVVFGRVIANDERAAGRSTLAPGGTGAPPVSAATVTQVAALLAAPARHGEPLAMVYARKEHELAAAFATLPVVEALALHRRLLAAHRDDALAMTFARLTADRRTRLLTFLAGARRREAVRAWR